MDATLLAAHGRVQAGVVVQLVMQSSGSFSVQIPANAIVVARVREDELSSTTAVRIPTCP